MTHGALYLDGPTGPGGVSGNQTREPYIQPEPQKKKIQSSFHAREDKKTSSHTRAGTRMVSAKLFGVASQRPSGCPLLGRGIGRGGNGPAHGSEMWQGRTRSISCDKEKFPGCTIHECDVLIYTTSMVLRIPSKGNLYLAKPFSRCESKTTFSERLQDLWWQTCIWKNDWRMYTQKRKAEPRRKGWDSWIQDGQIYFQTVAKLKEALSKSVTTTRCKHRVAKLWTTWNTGAGERVPDSVR